MTRLRRFLLGLCLCAGWMALILVGAAWIAERSGFLTRFVRDAVAMNLGALGDDLRIGHVRILWFECALEAESLEFGAKAEFARIESVRVELGFDLDFSSGFVEGLTPWIERAIVRDGRITWSRALDTGIQKAQQELEASGAFAQRRRRMPDLEIHAVSVEVYTRALGRLPLGVVDCALRANTRGEPELEGRIVPSLARGTVDPGEIYLFGRKSEPGLFDVSARAERVALGTQDLPDAQAYAALRKLEPNGFLDLRGKASFSISGATPPQLDLRLRVREGSVLVADGRRRVENVTLDVEAALASPTNETSTDPRAWSGTLRVAGELEGLPFEATGLLGSSAGRGLLAKAFAHVPRLPLAPMLLELIPGGSVARRDWDAFQPEGECEAWFAAELPSSWMPETALLDALTFGGHIEPHGTAGLRFRGWPHGEPAVYDGGFPIPIHNISGDVVCVVDRERLRPLYIGLVNLQGLPPSKTPIRASGWVASHARDVPIYLPSHGLPELGLWIRGNGLPIDSTLFDALHGLTRSVKIPWWKDYDPHGGTLDVDLHLTRAVDMNWIAVELELGLKDTNLTWTELPVPISQTSGAFHLVSDGQRESGVAFGFEGALATEAHVAIHGRFQTDPDFTPTSGGKDMLELSTASVDIQRLSLRGSDATTLIEYLQIAPTIEIAVPKGYGDIHFERTHATPLSSVLFCAEVRPLEPAEVKPTYFDMITKAIRGRVIVTGSEAGFEARLAPIVGTWGKDVTVAATGTFPGGTLDIYGAGLDPADKSLLGALSNAIRGPGGPGTASGTQALSVRGAVDLSGHIDLGDGASRKATTTFRFFLRGATLETAQKLRLDGLQGVLDLDDRGVLVGTELTAKLVDTPMLLSRAEFVPDKEAWSLVVDFSTLQGLPIDREHLIGFVDEKTLNALIGELGWKGRLDVQDGRLVVGHAKAGPRLQFSGSLTTAEMSIKLGLPLSIESARARVENLILDEGPVRAEVSIEELSGTIAERSFGPASLLLTYVEPKISIESLSGALEGGKILPLGVGAERSGTAFSLDLEDPYSFQLAIELQKVDVRGLLHGMLPSEFATRGSIDAKLNLTGDLERLLAIKGSGSLLVDDSRLWSIPVFRALLSQLGFDDTAVFESMATNINVADGRVLMEDISVTSPLTLELAGSGTLGFDGELEFDLDVRYGLVNHLGPITLLIYSIQNKLLRVLVRGDLGQPKIVLMNPFRNLFGGGKQNYRSLPTPSFSELPSRF